MRRLKIETAHFLFEVLPLVLFVSSLQEKQNLTREEGGYFIRLCAMAWPLLFVGENSIARGYHGTKNIKGSLAPYM